MKITKTPLEGLIIIEPDVFYDERGYFYESYNLARWSALGIDQNFLQDNESRSAYGVVRGLHYQLEPWAQAKLVRAAAGSVYDVAVDLRRNSPTFGKWFGLELSAENKLQMLIPKGFAHGFSVLSPDTLFVYKCDQFYNKQSERAILYNDPLLAIDWRVPQTLQMVSEKDKQAPIFSQAEMNF